MILRPVSPASPCGPPTTKRPVGLMRISASATSKPASPSTGRTTSAITPSRSSTLSILSECWVDTTTLLIPTGRMPSYTTLTWVLPSGRSHERSPAFPVHAQGDVARLAVDGGEDGTGLGVEAEARVRVADRADRPPHDVGNVDVRGGGDLPGDDGHARGDERLAGHAGGGVLGDDRVEDRVRDLVGDLVGMTFRHRLGGEDVALRGHVPVRPRVRRSS